jgi:hypothetical protein
MAGWPKCRPSFTGPPRKLENAVRRLLDLSVLYADINRETKMDGYHLKQLEKQSRRQNMESI